MADQATSEALARLEHKLDFLLSKALSENKALFIPPMGDDSHTCPVCKEGVKYIVDMMSSSVARQCGCKTGKIAPIDLGVFAPPMAAGGKNGNEGDATSERDDGGAGRDRWKGPRGPRSR